jgi:phage major head subunit gpT-like protein
MAVPHTSDNFGDLLDPRFQRIFDDKFTELPDMIPMLYNVEPTNGRDTMRWSDVGAVEDFIAFTGSVDYSSRNQGYDTIATPVEFARGIQVERKLFDDDQYNVMNQRPRALARAAFRTRQQHAADLFNNATSVVTTFYNNSEGVSLGSNSHTTTSGASTANGFDNLTTAALTAVAVQAARIQMRGFRGDQAERISVMPDTLLVPPDLEEAAFEITASSGKVDTADNNRNVHEGRYKVIDWEYLNDTNNWFLIDSSLKEEQLFWTDRIAIEFAMIDFDTLVAKWRGYMRYAMAHTDWRWVNVASVS